MATGSAAFTLTIATGGLVAPTADGLHRPLLKQDGSAMATRESGPTSPGDKRRA